MFLNCRKLVWSKQQTKQVFLLGSYIDVIKRFYFFPFIHEVLENAFTRLTDAKGSFTNYVDKILPFFDHLPPCVDTFYGMNVDKKWTFLNHLPTSSCKRSLWTIPKEGVRTARVAPPISKNFKVFSDPTLNRGLLWLSKQTNPLINQLFHICEFLHHHDLLLQGAYSIVYKVLYIKYSKHWPPYLLASTMDCGCSKILNHWLFLSLFKFFGWQFILNWMENSGLKSIFPYCLRF